MKKLKRVFCVLMTIVLLIGSVSFVVYAEDENRIVVRMYVCERTFAHGFRGHSWLYFENLTNSNQTVGIYTLPPNQGVSVGTYGHNINNGRGLYYNIEAYRCNKSKITDMVYISKDLTQKKLDKVSGKITRSGYWTYLLNCAYFSFTTWDVVSGKFLMYLVLPILAKVAILIYPSHETGLTMYYPRLDQIFKQVGYGKNATLVPTDPIKH